MVGMLAFMVQFSFQSKSCEQHAAVMRNGLQQCESVMAMNGIKFLSPRQEQGRIKSPEVLNIDLETAAWISLAVNLLSAMLYVDMLTTTTRRELRSALFW